MNAIIEGGTAAYGDGFLDEINRRIAAPNGGALKVVRDLIVRPSQDVGEIAAACAKSPNFSPSGLVGRALRRLAEAEGDDEADLLSYLLFDGGYGEQLVQLGMSDARARKEELAAFFADS